MNTRETMRVFIPSYQRSKTISTHKAVAGLDFRVVVHDEEERERYTETLPAERLVVSGVKPGKPSRQRQWICENLVNDGEWFLFIDDDVGQMTCVDDANYAETQFNVQSGNGDDWRRVFGQPCEPSRLIEIVEESISVAEQVGAHLCGFAVTPNYFFRGRKWRYAGYVASGLMVWHNVEFKFNHAIGMEDFHYTAEHLATHGLVVLNNWLWHGCRMYIAGGLGSYEDRKEQRARDCQKLMKLYPGLFRIRRRPDFDVGTDLSVRLHSSTQIARWRKELPELRIRAMGLGHDSWKQ